jgi:predicted dehydrogenase
MMSDTRRNFVKGAAAAVATQAFPVRGANDSVNLAVVGVGGRGRGHLGFYADVPGTRLAAICDVNQEARERASAMVQKLQGHKPKEYSDMRKLFEDNDIQAVSVATPNHWHALTTIWACQAGKDVYVEKPASHNPFEGEQMVKAARKYKRIVQVGSQSRSIGHKRHAIGLLSEGVIGQVYMARGLCFRRRKSIGHTAQEAVPPGLDWDFFLGPAPMRPYSKNRFAYNWHWFWDTGNGDIGNQGVHEMDICRWALGEYRRPKSITSTGGKFVWKGDQETPNTQQSHFIFDESEIVFDVRNLSSPPEGSTPTRGSSFVGNIIFGDEGYMVVDPYGFQVYKGDEHEKVMDEKPHEDQIWDPRPHMTNFIEAVRSRNNHALNADIQIGAAAAELCHLANISYRTGQQLHVDRDSGLFVGNGLANDMLTRRYREPYVVPENV